jgi:hypothetical protein
VIYNKRFNKKESSLTDVLVKNGRATSQVIFFPFVHIILMTWRTDSETLLPSFFIPTFTKR